MSALELTPELTRYISLVFMWCPRDGLSPCFYFVEVVLLGLATRRFLLRASARPGAPSPPLRAAMFGLACRGLFACSFRSFFPS